MQNEPNFDLTTVVATASDPVTSPWAGRRSPNHGPSLPLPFRPPQPTMQNEPNSDLTIVVTTGSGQATFGLAREKVAQTIDRLSPYQSHARHPPRKVETRTAVLQSNVKANRLPFRPPNPTVQNEPNSDLTLVFITGSGPATSASPARSRPTTGRLFRYEARLPTRLERGNANSPHSKRQSQQDTLPEHPQPTVQNEPNSA